MKNSPKIAIQASLDELDGNQAEKVLGYIKSLLSQPRRNRDYYEFKREALNEIQQALSEDKSFSLIA